LSFNTPDKHLGGMTYGGFSQTYTDSNHPANDFMPGDNRIMGAAKIIFDLM
jgi:hypothetical protein